MASLAIIYLLVASSHYSRMLGTGPAGCRRDVVVDARDYGAMGDGRDDTDAIQVCSWLLFVLVVAAPRTFRYAYGS